MVLDDQSPGLPVARPSLTNLIQSKAWIVVHIVSLLPLLILVANALTKNLSADPIQLATQRTGQYAFVWLIFTLACTPLNIAFGFREAIRYRRILGLYAFFYACIHLFIFSVLDYQLNLQFLLADINQKQYIFVGLAAFIILLALAITSFDWAKRVFRKKWKLLHRLVYAAGILAGIHYIWVVKADIRQPLFFTFLILFLISFRLPPIKNIVLRIRRSRS